MVGLGEADAPFQRTSRQGMALVNGPSLRQKLPLLASTLTVGALLIAGTFAYVEVRRAAVTSAETRLTSLTGELAALLEASIDRRMELQQQLVSAREVREALTGARVDTADLTLVLDSLRRDADGSLPVSVVRPDGTSVFAIGTMPRGADPDPMPPLEPTRTFGPLRELGDGAVVYWESIPVPGPDGAVIGWVAQRRRVGTGSQLENLFGSGIGFRLGQLGDSVWIGLQGARVEDTPASLVLGTPYTFTARDASGDGSEVLAMAGRVGTSPWVVLLDMPMSQVLARPYAFRNRVTTFGVILVLSVALLSWLGSRRLTNPLEELAEASDGIASGDYGRRVSAEGDDELGRLARAFNTMAQQVAHSEAALRYRLEEARALALRLEESHRAEEEAKREAQAANKAKADVLASISHEIRTPVSAVMAYSELLRNGVPDAPTEKQKEFLRRIDECALMLGSLVDDVLDFSVIESGELRVDIGVGCVNDAIRIATASVEPKAERKGIALTSRCADGAAFLGDPQRVRQIVMNLLSNAVKFTPEGGRIEVSCAERSEAPAQPGMDAGRWVAIQVEDTGVGIAPDQMERVFEPFAQAEGGSATERGPRSGVGLGLAISRHLAHAMAGTITVESEVGRGSRFTLWLPSGSREATERRARARPTRGRTRERTSRPA